MKRKKNKEENNRKEKRKKAMRRTKPCNYKATTEKQGHVDGAGCRGGGLKRKHRRKKLPDKLREQKQDRKEEPRKVQQQDLHPVAAPGRRPNARHLETQRQAETRKSGGGLKMPSELREKTRRKRKSAATWTRRRRRRRPAGDPKTEKSGEKGPKQEVNLTKTRKGFLVLFPDPPAWDGLGDYLCPMCRRED